MGDEHTFEVGKDLVTLDAASRSLAEKGMGEQDWSGIPVPVPGLSLVIEPRYKNKGLADFRWKECYDEKGVREEIEQEPLPEPSEYRRVNAWWSHKYQANVIVKCTEFVGRRILLFCCWLFYQGFSFG